MGSYEEKDMARGKHVKSKSAGTAKKKTAGTPAPKTGAQKKPQNKSRGKNILLAAGLIVVLLLAAALVAGMLIGRSGKIAPNINLGGTDLGGMTVTEAELALDKAGWKAQNSGEVEVKLPFDYKFTVTAKDAGLSLTSHEAAEAAMSYAHSGNPVKDLLSYLKCMAGKVTQEDVLTVGDTGGIRAAVDDALTEYNTMFDKPYKAVISTEKLMIIKGADSLAIDADELCEMIDEALKNGTYSVEYRVKAQSTAAPDFAKLHDELFCEVTEAVYDKEAKKFVPGKAGVDFDIDEAQRLWDAAEPGDTVEIPLKVTKPKIDAETDGSLFADKLGSQTTVFKTSTEGRATNVELSAAKVNGTVLNPGEVFSFNDVVGKRTAEAGFKSATAYAGGAVVEEIGGGICQTSSTIYCAALFANLEIVTRSEHGFAVSYVPYGMDATVSWGGPEFRFRNNRDFPIKIVAKTENRELTVEIWGTDVDGSYVEMTNSVSTRYDKKYPTVAIGTDAVTYRSVFDKDGKLLSRTLEAKSYYCYHPEDIKWPASPTPAQTVEPTPTPSAMPTATPEPTPEPMPEPTEEVIPTQPLEPTEEPLPFDPD